MRTGTTTKRLLKPLSLVAVIFLTVSGGPYGLEPLLQFAGKNGALLLLMVVPFLWDVPAILTVLELNSMMPVNGGYYKWVNRALGLRWAFYEGWWSWLYSFTDLAIYPVLFVTYLSFFFPDIAAYKIPVCLLVIWGSAGLNILGIVPVGRVSLILGTIVLVPFFILFGVSFLSPAMHFATPALSLNGVGFTSIGMGLYTVMWNFLGWDNTTTYAGEVDKPVRSYLISMGVSFIVVVVVYLLTTYVTQNSGVDLKELTDKGYPLLGVTIAGRWLGILLSIGGMASALGIFSAVILSISRVPKALAEDKLLPKVLGVTHKRFNTPYLAIIVCAVIVSFMVLWTFTDLLVIDVILYGAGLFLEFISLIVLRVNEPDAPRPFKIPLNVFGLSLMMLLPVSVYSIALVAVFSQASKMFVPAMFAVCALVTAEVVWWFVRRMNKW
ncbi:MAG TPA: APC family permease [Bacteroidia bacterium]|nr:APC family permease [Bacteroidia bacterium]